MVQKIHKDCVETFYTVAPLGKKQLNESQVVILLLDLLKDQDKLISDYEKMMKDLEDSNVSMPRHVFGILPKEDTQAHRSKLENLQASNQKIELKAEFTLEDKKQIKKVMSQIREEIPIDIMSNRPTSEQ